MIGARKEQIPPSLATGTTIEDGELTRTAPAEGARPALAPSVPRLVAPLQVRDPDRYHLLGEHGRGGLGRVSRAVDKELGREVAIKELIRRGDLGEVRFLREAMITARLDHPGIVPIYEAGRWPDGTPFYVMKLVVGRSLKELFEDRATNDERIGLLHHVVAIAETMAYAHERKIIHRDLKPANVIAGDHGETVVVDWGLAKDLDAPHEDEPLGGDASRCSVRTDLTIAGSVLGTPSYMAPEQARGEVVDQRADVYAIGAMLWELCSLERGAPHETLPRHARIDRDLVAIIEKAVAPDPAARYRDAGELASDLKAFAAGARIAARRYSPVALAVRSIRRHRIRAAAIVAGFAIAGCALHLRGLAGDHAQAAGRAASQRAIAGAECDRARVTRPLALLGSDPNDAHAVVTTTRRIDGSQHATGTAPPHRILSVGSDPALPR